MDFSIDLKSLKPVGYTIPTVSSRLKWPDYWGTIKVRWGFGRDNYTVLPGLYKVGKPDGESDVFVSANYKLSFDQLRRSLDSLDAWVLVIDTNGVNVWCAAGKGTFGTSNLVKSIKNISLDSFVRHHRIIVPQLGAVGVAAYKVKEQTGFSVIYGPVHAKDIRTFVNSGYKATPAMRTISFPVYERAKLVPVDMLYGKYKLLIALAMFFVLAGLDRTGIIFTRMVENSMFPLINIAGAYLAGIVVAPIFLPLIPFRAFALKGALSGIIITGFMNLFFAAPLPERIAMGLINIGIASFLTMNFTGSSTYTSLSGVKKEMKWAIPFQIASAAIGLIIFIIYKLK